MSLINQMLQDLERRSSGLPSSTKFEPAKSKSLGTDQEEKPKTHAFLKVTGTLILLYCAVFLWVKNPEIFRLFNQQKSVENPVVQTAPPPAPVQPATIQPVPSAAPQKAAEDIAPTQAAIASTPTQAAPSNTLPANPIATNSVEATTNVANEVVVQEEVKKPAKKMVTRHKPKSNLVPLPDDSIPMAVAVAPQNANEAKKAESVLAEFNKSKLRQPNGQAESGFSKRENTQQKSENLYRQALLSLQQGRSHEAMAQLSQALEVNPANEEARQTLAALLVDNKQIAEAMQILQDGLKQNPKQTGFRMALARMQLEVQSTQQALETMTEGLSDGRRDGSYQSFLANLLQRTERHDEAVAHFNTAIQLRGLATDYVGLGISLNALKKYDEARQAFNHALQSDNLTPDLRRYAEQQMQRMSHMSVFAK